MDDTNVDATSVASVSAIPADAAAPAATSTSRRTPRA